MIKESNILQVPWDSMQVKTFIKGKVCVRLYNCYFFIVIKNREKKKEGTVFPKRFWSEVYVLEAKSSPTISVTN